MMIQIPKPAIIQSCPLKEIPERFGKKTSESIVFFYVAIYQLKLMFQFVLLPNCLFPMISSGFSSVVLMCICKIMWCKSPTPHSWHMYSFSPVWVHRSHCKLSLNENNSSHLSFCFIKVIIFCKNPVCENQVPNSSRIRGLHPVLADMLHQLAALWIIYPTLIKYTYTLFNITQTKNPFQHYWHI